MAEHNGMVKNHWYILTVSSQCAIQTAFLLMKICVYCYDVHISICNIIIVSIHRSTLFWYEQKSLTFMYILVISLQCAIHNLGDVYLTIYYTSVRCNKAIYPRVILLQLSQLKGWRCTLSYSNMVREDGVIIFVIIFGSSQDHWT